MYKHIFSGMVVWGVLVTCFGLGALNPSDLASAAPYEEVIFLLAGGIVSALIGMIGLISTTRWFSDLSNKSGTMRTTYRTARQ